MGKQAGHQGTSFAATVIFSYWGCVQNNPPFSSALGVNWLSSTSETQT